METVFWAIFGVLVLALIIAIFIFQMTKKKKMPPDYYAFFVMGLVWLIVGFPLKNQGLILLGLIFVIIGLVNKSKWKKNKQTWDKLNKKEKLFRTVIVLVLFVLVLLGAIFLFLIDKGII